MCLRTHCRLEAPAVHPLSDRPSLCAAYSAARGCRGRTPLFDWCDLSLHFLLTLQAEDAEGETPLGAAAKHGKLREALAAVAKGEMTLDDLMLE